MRTFMTPSSTSHPIHRTRHTQTRDGADAFIHTSLPASQPCRHTTGEILREIHTLRLLTTSHRIVSVSPNWLGRIVTPPCAYRTTCTPQFGDPVGVWCAASCFASSPPPSFIRGLNRVLRSPAWLRVQATHGGHHMCAASSACQTACY